MVTSTSPGDVGAWQGGRGPAGEARGEGVAHDGQPHAREAKGRRAQAEGQAHGASAAALGGGESPAAGETGSKRIRPVSFFRFVQNFFVLAAHDGPAFADRP